MEKCNISIGQNLTFYILFKKKSLSIKCVNMAISCPKLDQLSVCGLLQNVNSSLVQTTGQYKNKKGT